MLSQRSCSILRKRSAFGSLASPQAWRPVTARANPSTARWASQQRPISGDDEAASQTLVKQRLVRPVAPHLTVYAPQIQYLASGLNRITGVVLSGGFYLYFMGYAAAPYLGLDLSSASVAAAVAGLPLFAKVLLKGTIAFPFVFHSFNGVRHLYLDTGMGFKNKQFTKTAWAVFGLSAVGTLYLASV